jgi:endonuclease/exonuclease/phosphatase family metal-dependent hydrolase
LKAITADGAQRHVRIAFFALIGALLATAIFAPAFADAAKKKKKSAKITVMTRNVYLGADLGPAIGAASLGEAIDGAGEIWNEVVSTNFPERAVPLGDEILEAKPHLVGLQEVALWRVQEPGDLGWSESGGVGTPATEPRYDFLELLMDQIGSDYKVVGVQDEFDAELPADTDQNNETGDPLFGSDLDARLTMRDVILVRKGSKVKAKKSSVQMAHFQNKYVADVGGVPVEADRGWISVEAKYKKNKKTKPNKFRFVNTHLEAFGDPEIREEQAMELFNGQGYGEGPLNTKKKVVLVGDLNSGLPDPHNIGAGGGGSGDPEDTLAFEALLGFGMQDRGAVQSCCYSDLFDPAATFTHTVDHVLVKPNAKLLNSFVTGNDASERTPSGLWPSDHGGVVSKLKLKK